VFSKPVIDQPVSKGSMKYISSGFVNAIFPDFAGKYKFCDTLLIPTKPVNDTSYQSDFIDDLPDSITTDGFEIIPDYNSSIRRPLYGNQLCYYPVYIVNETKSSKAFLGKDLYVFGLQEALDTNGTWRPIEGRGFDFCGNGYWALLVHPQEFIAILFPKYAGSYKTKIRVRIQNENNIYVSKPFDATINESQLYLKEDSYLYNELKENKASAIQHLFYGAAPMGTDDKNFGLHAVWTK
jgi:hypothetical protein